MSRTTRSKTGYTPRARKRDANEPEIIEELENCPGVSVYVLDKPLDLLAGFDGADYLIEVKNPNGKNRIEKDQQEFFDTWKGRTPVIVRTREDVRNWYNAICRERHIDRGGLSGIRRARVE